MIYFQGKKRFLGTALLLATVAGLFFLGRARLHIESDITAALPQDDPVVSAARLILKHHPALDHVYIDLSPAGGGQGRNVLARAGDLVVKTLEESGLVKVVSRESMSEMLPKLFSAVVDHLPLFFSETELNREVAVLLSPEKINRILAGEQQKLFQLDSIGQARFLGADPLGLRNPVLARFGQALPISEASIFRGHIFTKDYKHLLIMADPGTSNDSAFALKLARVLDDLAGRLAAENPPEAVKMVYAGSFRAALDNEQIIKKDTHRAIILVTIGVLLLALFCFRRPWIGFLAVAPAVSGALAATFVYSLFNDVIFAVALGFGGALISITVDHGLAYVLVLDQPRDTRGRDVSREVWSVTSFTVYTTVAALFSLTFSGIPLFSQVGLFAALGVGLSALFVHLIFPMLFPELKAVSRRALAPMDRIMDWLTASTKLTGLAAAVIFFLVMLFFAKPNFNADLKAMNTVKPETLAAEETISRAWGDLTGRIYILTRGKNLTHLRRESQRLVNFLEQEKAGGILEKTHTRAALLPGPELQRQNLAAWKHFWNPERTAMVKAALRESAQKLGFTPEAFEPFYQTLENPPDTPLEPDPALLPALGISRDKDGSGYLLLEALTPGPEYQARYFFDQALKKGFTVFDGEHFAAHLAGFLNSSFIKMILIIGLAALALLFLLFADWQLVLLSFSPLIFSLTATVGTLNLLGLPLAIPSLMLAPVVVGLGMDYGLYLVRSRQRFGAAAHPGLSAFKGAILLGGLSTLIGMGSLALSGHQVLKMAGLSTFLGIAYAMIGTFTIVPPLLARIFAYQPPEGRKVKPGSAEHRRLALTRYRHLEPHPRMYARFKMLLDPMFPRLADFIKPGWKIIDLGCGFGIPASWLLAIHPGLTFISLEPDPERARLAGRALRHKAEVHHGGAIELDRLETGRFDGVLMLDMAHYLPDEELSAVLSRLRQDLNPGGRLIMRVTIPGGTNQVWQRRLETWRIKRAGLTPHFRTAAEITSALETAGFTLEITEPTAPGREETWFIAGV